MLGVAAPTQWKHRFNLFIKQSVCMDDHEFPKHESSKKDGFESLLQDPRSCASQGAAWFGLEGEDRRRFLQWRWHMKHQLQSLDDFKEKAPLSPDEALAFTELESLFHVGVSPYYATLIHAYRHDPVIHRALRLQVIPQSRELQDPLGLPDPLTEKAHSPVREVVHLYPDRVAFCVAMLCPVYCRYCYRKRREAETGLHFNRGILERGLAYIRATAAIRDVLITGGDPFIASDEALISLVAELRSIPHVEIIRFGTRTPVALPYLITKELCRGLAQYHPIWINTHFNHPAEITKDAGMALNLLADHGFPVGNQSVLLKGVNDHIDIQKDLYLGLIRHRVRPYYLFHPHRVMGTEHLRVSVARGLAIMEGLRGRVTGFGIPTYIMDTPSGKIPLMPGYILGQDGDDLLLRNVHGEIWRETGAFLEG